MPLVLRNTKGAPLTWDEVDGNFTFLQASIASAVAAHEAAGDPHPQYTTVAEAAAAAPVQTVMGRAGAVVLLDSDIITSLGYVPESASNKGAAGGYASLDMAGKVPAGQLPSYVDDVAEVADYAALPVTGEVGKIYVTLADNKLYRWSGSAYIEIVASPGSTDAVPEGSLNLYFTNARARNAISVTQNLTYNASTGVITGPNLSGYAPLLDPHFTNNVKVGGSSYNPFGVAFRYGYNVGWTNPTDDGAGPYLTSDGNYLSFVTGAAERMHITSSGLVTYTNDIQVNKAAGTGVVRATGDSSVTAFLFGSSSGGVGAVGTESNHPFALYANNTERLRLSPDGALGIGGANYGTSGQVLKSQGAGSPPVWGDSAGSALGKNVLINGGMDIWQRGTSVSVATDALNQYQADRWQVSKTGAMQWTYARSTDVPTIAQAGRKFNYSLGLTCSVADASLAASEATRISQNVEGYNWLALAGRACVGSFWVKSSTPGVYCAALGNSGVDRSFVGEFTVDVADTWEFKTVQFTASPSAGTWDYTSGIGVRFHICVCAGSSLQTTPGAWQTGNYFATANQVNLAAAVNNYIRVTGFQLEAGDTPTEFESKSIAQILHECCRYYCVTRGNARFFAAGGGHVMETAIYFPTQMRIEPITSNASGGLRTNLAGGYPNTDPVGGAGLSARFTIASNGPGECYALREYVYADAEL